MLLPLPPLYARQVDGNLLSTVLRKRVTLVGTTLRTRSVEYKRTLVSRFAAEALPQIASGTYQ